MQFVQILFLLLNLGVAFSAPNHSKTEILETNEIPAVSLGAGGVSASWGGYSAKAGFGGNTGASGGLFASADSPHGSAAAGLGGNVGGGDAVSGGLGASASSPYGGSASAGLGGTTGVSKGVNIADTVSGSLGASASSPYGGSAGAGLGGSSGTTFVKGSPEVGNTGGIPFVNSGVSAGTASTGGHTQVVYSHSNQKPGGLFDNIFNIPISVLQSVNGYLNQQQGGHVTKTVHGNRRHRPVVDNRSSFSQSESSGTVYEQHPLPEHPFPIAGHGGGVGSAGATVTYQKRPVNYDNIFNIPISALRAVNKLLNDGAASLSKSIQVQGGAHASHNHGGSVQVAQSHAQAHAGSSQIPQTHTLNVQPASNAASGTFEGGVHVEKDYTQVPQAYNAQKPAGFYDNVFNIPITALKSVNQLLNG